MGEVELGASAWRELARCQDADPSVFFPARGGHYTDALAICETCLVREACLEDALERERGETVKCRAGVWGGTTPRERHRMDRLAAA